MQFGWSDSRRNLVTLGQKGHGKTTLIGAIGKVSAVGGSAGSSPLGPSDSQPFEFEAEDSKYSISEYEGGLLGGGAPLNSAILVVAATDGPMPQTRDHILAAREAQVPSMLVFLNKLDLIDDTDLLDLVELEIRELISQHGYPGDDVPVIRGSALKASTSKSKDRAAREYQCIHELLRAIASNSKT